MGSALGKNTSPPPAPNYQAAAQAQATSNQSTAQGQAVLSNPNIYTPYGSQTVAFGPRTFDQSGYDAQNAQLASVGVPGVDPNNFWQPGQATVTQSLTPAGQQLFDVGQQTQLGLGNLANQSIGQVQSALGQPFNPTLPPQVSSLSMGNYQGGPSPTTGGTPDVQQYTSGSNVAPGQTTSAQGAINPTTSANILNPSGGPIQTGLGDAGGISRGFADVGNNQRSLDLSSAPSMPQASFTGASDPVTQAIVQRAQPFMDTQKSQLNTQLVNQGLVPGDEAYTNAMRNFDQQQNNFLLGAIQQGSQQQQALYGEQLAGRQQGVSELGQQGAFANSAQGQAFQQSAMRGDFGNQAQQQAFAQNLAGGQFGNQAQSQAYGQAYGNAGLNLGAQQQAFGQNVTADQSALARQQQAYGQQLSGSGLNLGAQQQAYGQQMGLANLGLGAEQQQFGQQSTQAQMANQAQQANLGQQQAVGQFQNQARGQSLQEQAYMRQLPLNQVSALMSGSQVGTPQFSPFTGAPIGQTPVFGAAQAQGQYNQGLYNAQTAGQNAQTSGLYGLGGALGAGYLMAPAAGAAGAGGMTLANALAAGLIAI